MKIECKAKRRGGSDIDIGGVVYEFRPNDKGEHVCEVDNEAHAQRFLSIVEGYKIQGAVDAAPEPESKGDITMEYEGPSAALDDDAVADFLVGELGIEDPMDAEELREYCAEVLDLDVPDISMVDADDVAMFIGRFIIDGQPSEDDEEMTDVDVLTHVSVEFGIKNPSDIKELKAYAKESLGLKLGRMNDAIKIARLMIEADKQSEAE